jgi:hypothetical protein
MTIPKLFLGATVAIAGFPLVAGNAAPLGVVQDQVELASHRAVYDLKLAHSRGSSSTMAVRGRILYDFSGSSCEGYALQFRQVSELDNGEGQATLSDLRSTSWEDVAAKRFIFKSQNFQNEVPQEAVDGEAERVSDRIRVSLRKPADKQFELETAIVFPTDHMRRIIAAAREEKSILELPVFDGSEKGDKVFNTLTVIGHAIEPTERIPSDAAAGKAPLTGLRRWPVTVSYFDRAAKIADQPPVYAITFELYENGVSRALVLDYNDFAISGELTSIDIRSAGSCR